MSVCKTSAQIDSLAIKEKKARKINCQKIQKQIKFCKSIGSNLKLYLMAKCQQIQNCQIIISKYEFKVKCK